MTCRSNLSNQLHACLPIVCCSAHCFLLSNIKLFFYCSVETVAKEVKYKCANNFSTFFNYQNVFNFVESFYTMFLKYLQLRYGY